MGKLVYRRSVEMAAEILGGNQAVAHYLGVAPDDVLSWLEGKTEPATKFFLRLAELIEQKTVNAARAAAVVRSRRGEAG